MESKNNYAKKQQKSKTWNIPKPRSQKEIDKHNLIHDGHTSTLQGLLCEHCVKGKAENSTVNEVDYKNRALHKLTTPKE
eukprot:2039368-Amphidinium_carterae.1